jgi:hypothetical protein
MGGIGHDGLRSLKDSVIEVGSKPLPFMAKAAGRPPLIEKD